jgi:hypothetical protein
MVDDGAAGLEPVFVAHPVDVDELRWSMWAAQDDVDGEQQPPLILIGQGAPAAVDVDRDAPADALEAQPADADGVDDQVAQGD